MKDALNPMVISRLPCLFWGVGGMGLAIHLELLRSSNDGIPLVMAHGLPVSGKSLAVGVAMVSTNAAQVPTEASIEKVVAASAVMVAPSYEPDTLEVNFSLLYTFFLNLRSCSVSVQGFLFSFFFWPHSWCFFCLFACCYSLTQGIV